MTWAQILRTASAALCVTAVVTFAVWKLDKLQIIDRHALDWGAFATLTGSFATLATGLAAVAGAVWLGARQVGISERQTTIQERQADILSRQVHLQELTLRSELYEKRLVVYNAVADYINTALMDGRSPNKEIKDRLLVALASSRFVFRTEVHEVMRKIFALSMKLDILDGRMQRAQDQRDTAGEEKAADEKHQVFDDLSEYQRTLPETFSELRLVVEPQSPAAE